MQLGKSSMDILSLIVYLHESTYSVLSTAVAMATVNVRTRTYINLVPGRYMVGVQKVNSVALTPAGHRYNYCYSKEAKSIMLARCLPVT